MITHIFKNGATTNDITGHLVKRTDCPTAYAVMERMRHDNERVKNGGAQARQEVPLQGEESQERQHEGAAHGVR